LNPSQTKTKRDGEGTKTVNIPIPTKKTASIFLPKTSINHLYLPLVESAAAHMKAAKIR
jgi:hypothetical protein